MATGTVKWFNKNRGYGFIEPKEGGNDIFVHISAIQESEVYELQENDKVKYDLKEENGKVCAINIEKA